MRLLFVADGRSPTTLSWLGHWLERRDEVHLISTYPCDPPPGLASFHVLPVAFNRFAGGQVRSPAASSYQPGLKGRYRGILLSARYVLGPLSLPPYQRRFRRLVTEIAPDLVHALRIPFEGMLASAIPSSIPLVVSIWGNDIILHAQGSFLMATLTRRTLQRAKGLMADASRDIRLGHEWGFSGPSLVIPGGGGIRLEEAGMAPVPVTLPEELPEVPVVVNPRGQRPGSLRQDVFFQSIPLVLEKIPQAMFVCPPLAGDMEAARWVAELGIAARTKLWPFLTQSQLRLLFKKSQVFVSPSVHDGLPNSLLEAMSCGCFPVVGDIESMREWITPGVNGLLVDATDRRALADAIVQALNQSALRTQAAQINTERIAERAVYARNMARVDEFYQALLAG